MFKILAVLVALAIGAYCLMHFGKNVEATAEAGKDMVHTKVVAEQKINEIKVLQKKQQSEEP